jgi:hypothetical protein
MTLTAAYENVGALSGDDFSKMSIIHLYMYILISISIPMDSS